MPKRPLEAVDSLVAEPEAHQRADNQTRRAAHGGTDSEQNEAIMFGGGTHCR